MSCILPALGLILAGCNSGPVPDGGATAAMPRQTVSAANDWYRQAGVDRREIEQLPVDERARRLTQAVYAFCDQGNRTDPDLNALFEECVAACGGISHVLRGLLEATGARTRFVNLYNIPNQGNHTAVEVYVDGQWKFFDPTFGVFFTRDGRPDGEVLSIGEVAMLYTPEELGDRVQQAIEDGDDFASAPLARLYGGRFEHPFMAIENYQVFESRSRLDRRELVILDIPLTLHNGIAGIGDFDAASLESAQAAWLEQTNALLLDDDLENDISFVSQNLANGETERLNTISVSGLTPGARYELSLFVIAEDPATIEIVPMGRSVRYGGPKLMEIESGRNTPSVTFMAAESEGRLAVRSLGNRVVVNMLGVAIQESGGG